MESLQINPTEFGVVGLVLIVLLAVINNVLRVWADDIRERRKLERYKEEVRARGGGAASDDSPPPASLLLCQQDPMHFQRITAIHNYTEDVQKRIASKEFACVWKDRDEVRDFIQIQRDVLKAIRDLTREMRALNNGGYAADGG